MAMILGTITIFWAISFKVLGKLSLSSWESEFGENSARNLGELPLGFWEDCS